MTLVCANKREDSQGARSDLFERRRKLMDEWSEYLAGRGDDPALG